MTAAPRARVQRRPVHGVILLDKPLGLSSNQALQKVKWLLRAEKAGHTGTLDPLATGVLPLCFGAATKFSQQHLNAAAGFLRNGLFKRLHIHTVPTLHFIFDRTTERASDMNALIAKAVASRSKDSD